MIGAVTPLRAICQPLSQGSRLHETAQRGLPVDEERLLTDHRRGGRRFGREATASLPEEMVLEGLIGPNQVLEGLVAKRLMLRATQQLPEWNGQPSPRPHAAEAPEAPPA